MFSDYRKYRILEMIPGLLTWTTFILALVFSFIKPIWVIYFIIIFDLLWLTRIFYLLPYLLISYVRFRRVIKVDWLGEIKKNSRWEEIIHLVFLPTYKEGLDVLRSTFQSLRDVDYPSGKIIVVLATEERDRKNAQENARLIKQEFGHVFRNLLVTLHPQDIPGELAGKGANNAYAARMVKELIDQEKIPYENIIVSSFDVDTCVHSQYFAYLTYVYLNHPNPTKTSYQPVPLYNNNIWDSPALMRVVANGTSFWLMTEQLRPERLLTFSSHSMSFQALVDVDFWQNDIVTEDSRIFLQCFLRYDGDYAVTPLYMPISMDTVSGKNLWESLKNQYRQQRRWGYGVEHLPYMLWFFAKNKKISFFKKFRYVWNLGEGMYSWATAPILIFVLGRLPLFIAAHTNQVSFVAQLAPFILERLMITALVGLLVMAVLSTTLLPPRPRGVQRIKFIELILQWVLFPLTMIFFGSIPAADAQTRLMLGKYLGFNVTQKFRRR